jgi:hypothetical protein
MVDRDKPMATWAEFLDVHMTAISLVERTRWETARRARVLESLSGEPDDWRLVALQLATWLGEELDLSPDAFADWADRRRRDALDGYSEAREDRLRSWSEGKDPGAVNGLATD